MLTHWGRATHICSKLTIIGSDNGLSPDRRQAIIWTNAGLLLIRPLGTNFSEILIEILAFSFKKMRLKVASAKRRPFCLGLNMLITKLCILDKYHPIAGIENALCSNVWKIWGVTTVFSKSVYQISRILYDHLLLEIYTFLFYRISSDNLYFLSFATLCWNICF